MFFLYRVLYKKNAISIFFCDCKCLEKNDQDLCKGRSSVPNICTVQWPQNYSVVYKGTKVRLNTTSINDRTSFRSSNQSR